MQFCSARSELLEDNQVDAVGIYLEGNWQVRPAQVAAESIDQVCQWAEYHHGQLVGLDVGRRKHARLESLTPDTCAGERHRSGTHRVGEVRSGLKYPSPTAQDRIESASFFRGCIRRRHAA